MGPPFRRAGELRHLGLEPAAGRFRPLPCESLQLRLQPLDLLDQLRGAGLQRRRRPRQRLGLGLEMRQRLVAAQRLDAPHPAGNRGLRDDGEGPDLSGARHVGTAAQFATRRDAFLADPLDRHHAHLGAVLLAEQRHGAGRLGLRDRQHLPRHLPIAQHPLAHPVFDRFELLA